MEDQHAQALKLPFGWVAHKCSVCNAIEAEVVVRLRNIHHLGNMPALRILVLFAATALGVALGVGWRGSSYNTSVFLLQLLALLAGVSSLWSG